ncbi:hypothetical protein PsYK624_167800 [Phanerochaete sordida]|uniref:Uncharacterized protein n=1 Tax=Phanerochaete sordida TaxID=48140 RepID=A0A9P3GRG0_9APHY|nr:hypothetical protein PsYK624_167800 [Phanerochaete sordida]
MTPELSLIFWTFGVLFFSWGIPRSAWEEYFNADLFTTGVLRAAATPLMLARNVLEHITSDLGLHVWSNGRGEDVDNDDDAGTIYEAKDAQVASASHSGSPQADSIPPTNIVDQIQPPSDDLNTANTGQSEDSSPYIRAEATADMEAPAGSSVIPDAANNIVSRVLAGDSLPEAYKQSAPDHSPNLGLTCESTQQPLVTAPPTFASKTLPHPHTFPGPYIGHIFHERDTPEVVLAKTLLCAILALCFIRGCQSLYWTWQALHGSFAERTWAFIKSFIASGTQSPLPDADMPPSEKVATTTPSGSGVQVVSPPDRSAVIAERFESSEPPSPTPPSNSLLPEKRVLRLVTKGSMDLRAQFNSSAASSSPPSHPTNADGGLKSASESRCKSESRSQHDSASHFESEPEDHLTDESESRCTVESEDGCTDESDGDCTDESDDDCTDESEGDCKSESNPEDESASPSESEPEDQLTDESEEDMSSFAKAMAATDPKLRRASSMRPKFGDQGIPGGSADYGVLTTPTRREYSKRGRSMPSLGDPRSPQAALDRGYGQVKKSRELQRGAARDARRKQTSLWV